MIIHTIEARTHGRYLVDRPDTPKLTPMLVGFHGYGETAESMLQQLRLFGEDWCKVSVQALHRFYTRSQEIAASWMTRQDREFAIADNTDYVWSVVEAIERDHRSRRPLVFVGFSQGAAMAYRAAAARPCDGLIVLAGDVPPDVAPRASELPPILIGRGTRDEWYTEAKAAADLALLKQEGASVQEHAFEGGHEWGETFKSQARRFLERVAAPRR